MYSLVPPLPLPLSVQQTLHTTSLLRCLIESTLRGQPNLRCLEFPSFFAGGFIQYVCHIYQVPEIRTPLIRAVLSQVSCVVYLFPVYSSNVYMSVGFCLGRLVWFVVDEYYCSETTTTQACLGYVSLGHYSIHTYIVLIGPTSPKQLSTVGLLYTHPFSMYILQHTLPYTPPSSSCQVRSHGLGYQGGADTGGGQQTQQTQHGTGVRAGCKEPCLHSIPAWQFHLHHDQRGIYSYSTSRRRRIAFLCSYTKMTGLA